MRDKLAWSALTWVSALAAAWAARKATTMIWARVSGNDDPTDPSEGDTSWGEALAWAVVAGAIASTARVVAKRGASEAWEAATGEAPPGI